MMFIMMSIIVFGQDAQVTKTKVSEEINSVVNNVYDKAEQAVKQLADVLKVPAEHVYFILVKQQIVTGISLLIGLLLSLLLSYISYRLLLKFHDFEQPWYDQSVSTEGYWTLFIVSSVMSIALLIINLCRTPGYLLNPEYEAIKEIMHMF